MKTNSWINGKNPMLIPIPLIRPTNLISEEKRKVSDTPIMLVEGGDGFFYIVDGNHRFYNRLLKKSNEKSLLAWIISENEKLEIKGEPLPTYMQEWVEGKLSLHQFTELAINAYKEIEGKISGLLEFHLKTTKVDIRNKAFEIAASIMKILEGKTTQQEESIKIEISQEEMSSFQKCFIDGGIKAIYETIKLRGA